jgi:UDP-N-acetyl-D-glucosamine dehydrogenase
MIERGRHDVRRRRPGGREAADIVIVLTDHDAIGWDLLGRYGEEILDTGNRLAAPGVDRL